MTVSSCTIRHLIGTVLSSPWAFSFAPLPTGSLGRSGRVSLNDIAANCWVGPSWERLGTRLGPVHD